MVENQDYGVEEDDFSGISAVPQKVEMEVTSIAQAGEASQVHRDHDGENTTVLPSCASKSVRLALQAWKPEATFAVHSLRENFSNEAV